MKEVALEPGWERRGGSGAQTGEYGSSPCGANCVQSDGGRFQPCPSCLPDTPFWPLNPGLHKLPSFTETPHVFAISPYNLCSSLRHIFP